MQEKVEGNVVGRNGESWPWPWLGLEITIFLLSKKQTLKKTLVWFGSGSTSRSKFIHHVECLVLVMNLHLW